VVQWVALWVALLCFQPTKRPNQPFLRSPRKQAQLSTKTHHLKQLQGSHVAATGIITRYEW